MEKLFRKLKGSKNYDAVVTLALHQGLAMKDTFKLFQLSAAEKDIYWKIVKESVKEEVASEEDFEKFKERYTS